MNILEQIKTMEENLTSKMVEFNPGCEVIESVMLTNKSIDPNLGVFRLFSNITGRFKNGHRTSKFEDRLIFTYCPFCGVKY